MNLIHDIWSYFITFEIFKKILKVFLKEHLLNQNTISTSHLNFFHNGKSICDYPVEYPKRCGEIATTLTYTDLTFKDGKTTKDHTMLYLRHSLLIATHKTIAEARKKQRDKSLIQRVVNRAKAIGTQRSSL